MTETIRMKERSRGLAIMSSKVPLCSVLIPTFNQVPEYLCAAIQSARLQTIPVEICVCDDGSDPRQEDVVRASWMEDGDATIKYTWQPNGGVASALNTCLEMSTSDWIAWLPSDDLYTADHLQVMLEAIEGDLSEPQWSIAYSSYEEGIPIPQARWPAAQFPSFKKQFEALQRGCFINAATLLWHRSVFDEVGSWDTNIRHAQDFEHILRCAEWWNFLAVHHYGVRRRLHPKQMVHTLRDPAERATKEADMAYLKERYGVVGGVWVPEEPKGEKP